MSHTGGGVGTNQHGIRGVGQASQQDVELLSHLAMSAEVGDSLPEGPPRTYKLAFTRRRSTSTEPIGHASTSRRNGRTMRSSFVALCGAAIANPGPGGMFDPTHPRACRRCAENMRR